MNSSIYFKGLTESQAIRLAREIQEFARLRRLELLGFPVNVDELNENSSPIVKPSKLLREIVLDRSESDD